MGLKEPIAYPEGNLLVNWKEAGVWKEGSSEGSLEGRKKWLGGLAVLTEQEAPWRG